MKFYIQIDENNYIHDCLEYQYNDYQGIEIALPLPNGVLGGWWKLENGTLVYDRKKFEEINEIELLQHVADEAMDIIEGKVIPNES